MADLSLIVATRWTSHHPMVGNTWYTAPPSTFNFLLSAGTRCCVIGTARIVYAERGLCNGTVSVCLSVCLSVSLAHSPAAATCGGFAAVGPASGDIDRLLHSRRSAAAAGECEQCHVVSVRRKLSGRLVTCIQSAQDRRKVV